MKFKPTHLDPQDYKFKSTKKLARQFNKQQDRRAAILDEALDRTAHPELFERLQILHKLLEV